MLQGGGRVGTSLNFSSSTRTEPATCRVGSSFSKIVLELFRAWKIRLNTIQNDEGYICRAFFEPKNSSFELYQNFKLKPSLELLLFQPSRAFKLGSLMLFRRFDNRWRWRFLCKIYTYRNRYCYNF